MNTILTKLPYIYEQNINNSKKEVKRNTLFNLFALYLETISDDKRN